MHGIYKGKFVAFANMAVAEQPWLQQHHLAVRIRQIFLASQVARMHQLKLLTLRKRVNPCKIT